MKQLEKPRLAESWMSCYYNEGLHEKTAGHLFGNYASIGCGSHNWRLNLAIDLQTAASDSQKVKIKHVNSICGDLETTRDTVERSLQEPLAEVSTL